MPAKRSKSRVSHSQITSGSQPAVRNDSRTRLSRSVFLANFKRQKSAFDAGVVAWRQPGWRCQKQPWTRTTFRRDGKTRSGRPGRSRRWSRKRYPRRWARRRTIISGRVSRPRMRDITFDRFSDVKTSMQRPIWSARQSYRSSSYGIKPYPYWSESQKRRWQPLVCSRIAIVGCRIFAEVDMERSDDGLPGKAAALNNPA